MHIVTLIGIHDIIQKTDSGSRFALVTNVYNKTDSDTRYYTKPDSDNKFVLITNAIVKVIVIVNLH